MFNLFCTTKLLWHVFTQLPQKTPENVSFTSKMQTCKMKSAFFKDFSLDFFLQYFKVLGKQLDVFFMENQS